MVIRVHYLDISPPCRAVLLTVKALNLDVEYKEVDMWNGEHLKPDYLKLNPQHTIPVLEDGDLVVTDSHAIVAYLAAKYGKDDSLYPKDLEKRAIVDQRLHFDSSVLFSRLLEAVMPLWLKKATTISEETRDAIAVAFGFLEQFLKNGDFVAGDDLTVADLSIVATVSSFDAFIVEIKEKDFPRLARWFAQMKRLPYYAQANQLGLEKYAALLKNRMT